MAMKRLRLIRIFSAASFLLLSLPAFANNNADASLARHWNETLLEAIRSDTARPTVHARNLFHLSAAMWDAWAAYEETASQVFHQEKVTIEPAMNVDRLRAITLSQAAHTLLSSRFVSSPNALKIQAEIDTALVMARKHYIADNADAQTALDLGDRIARTIIKHGLSDGSNEAFDYQSLSYQPLNEALRPDQRGNPLLVDADRWQPLELVGFVGQSGIPSSGYPPFVGPEWGSVQPFSLLPEDRILKRRNGVRYSVYFDAGPPPSLTGTENERVQYQQGFKEVLLYSAQLDANNDKQINISPAVRGNNPLGTNEGEGYTINPVTGRPYAPTLANAADFYRVLAEFWADGPDSETPPGHWFVMFNLVSDQASIVARLGGQYKAKTRLQWDLQGYLALGGAMHDAAIAAWSHKGWYDFIRPISAIRYLCKLGQSTDSSLPNYHPLGMPLQTGLVELTTNSSLESGNRHHHLAEQGVKENELVVKTWRGASYVENRRQDVAGVGWIACGDWWPYQRPNFVTPPFAGYVSGHSTFSRAAAEILTLLTESAYFPGGLGIFTIRQNKFLVFERGPSQDVKLQWATYQDAADDSAISRIYGGIHPRIDDIPGRLIGYKVGHRAYKKALSYFPK